MGRSIFHLVATLAIAAAATASHAGIVNPSFDDVFPSPRSQWHYMLPSGWSADIAEDDGTGQPYDLAWVSQYDTWGSSPITPSNGGWMAIVTAGGYFSQEVSLTAGDQILVDFAVSTTDLFAFGTAFMALQDGPIQVFASFEVPFNSDFGTQGSQRWLNWQTLTLTVPSTGTYTLSLNGQFNGAGNGEHYTFFDNVRIVPAPGSLALLGLTSLVPPLRRRR